MNRIIFVVFAALIIVGVFYANSITGNIVKLPLLKNLAPKSNVGQTVQPPSEGDMELREGTFSANRKRADRYYGSKQAFLVSDKDWHNALSLVPVAMWQEGSELKKYPVLIYHEEDNGFDADSAITFLRQFNAKKVVLVGNTPEELDNILIADGYTYMLEAEAAPLTPSLSPVTGRPIADIPPVRRDEITAPARGIDLTPDWLTRISPDDYARYWSNYNIVVVSEDNYQLGLLASVYASYLNAPLFFEGRVPSDVSLARKRIITVGSTSYTGEEAYTLEQLERKLLELYPTDKIMLVNPNDLSIWETKEQGYNIFRTLLSRAQINELYSKTSLSAPLLAAGKKEIIFSTTETGHREIDSFIDRKIRELRLNPEYLTIMAAPIAVQMDKPGSFEGDYEEIDNHIYGDVDSDGFQDLAVGRIFSLTSSDISAYIARDLFLDSLPKAESFATLTANSFPQHKVYAKEADRVLDAAGLAKQSVYIEGEGSFDAERDMERKMFVAYQGHGNTASAGITTSGLRIKKVKMQPMISIAETCLTCAYTRAKENEVVHPESLLCANMLRHGAMGYVGSIDEVSAAGTKFVPMVAEELAKGMDSGHALKAFKAKTEIYKRNLALATLFPETPYDEYFVLIGDPTIRLFAEAPSLEDTAVSTEVSGDIVKARIRISQPSEEVHFSCEGEDCDFPGIYEFYANPAGSAHIGGLKQISTEPLYTESEGPELKDYIYWEMDGSHSIRSATLKVNYADGTQKTMRLSERDGLFYYEDSISKAYLHGVGVKGKEKFSLNYEEQGAGAGKILPSYEYEIEMEAA